MNLGRLVGKIESVGINEDLDDRSCGYIEVRIDGSRILLKIHHLSLQKVRLLGKLLHTTISLDIDASDIPDE